MHRQRIIRAAVAALVVTAITSGVTSATFPGRPGRISFVTYVEETDSLEIFTARSDGTDHRQLTHSGEGHSSVQSDWSPDGRWIAFDSDRTGNVETFVVDADGGHLRQLTSEPTGFQGEPAWSPDGKRIAIDADWGDIALQGIWTVPTNRSEPVGRARATRITDIPDDMLFDTEPQFSPDGKRLVFTRYKACEPVSDFTERCESAIFVVRVDGSGLQRLTPWALNASYADWSPNGKRITFDSCDSPVEGCRGDIWVMDADGDHRTRLTHSAPIHDAGGPDEVFDLRQNPVWSPAGDVILFTHFIDGGTDIVRIRRNGRHETIISPEPQFQNRVDWGTRP